MYSTTTAEFENEDISKIHLTVEEPPCHLLTKEYSEYESCMSDHQGQIKFLAIVIKGPVFISMGVLYSLAYDAIDVMNDDNIATVLSAQIQVILVLIGTVRKYVCRASSFG